MNNVIIYVIFSVDIAVAVYYTPGDEWNVDPCALEWGMQAVLSAEQAQAALRPYLGAIWSSVAGGVADYLATDPGQRAVESPRTRASRIHDRILHRAYREFASFGHKVRFLEKKGLRSLIIEERFHLRFKKLDWKFRPRNILTAQQVSLLEQIAVVLPELPPLINLIAGYRWNHLQTKISGVYVVCPRGPHAIAWVLPVEPPAGDNKVVEIPRTLPAAGTIKGRVRIKEQATVEAVPSEE